MAHETKSTLNINRQFLFRSQSKKQIFFIYGETDSTNKIESNFKNYFFIHTKINNFLVVLPIMYVLLIYLIHLNKLMKEW